MIFPSPFLTRHILDEVIPEKKLSELFFMIIAVLIILSVQRIVSYYQGLIFYRINSKIIFDIRIDMLRAINNITAEQHLLYGSGYLMSRINDDTDRLHSLFADSMIDIIKDVLTLIFGCMAIFYLHWKLALTTIVLLPLFLFTSSHFSKKIKLKSTIFYENNSQCSRTLEECLNSSILQKLFGRLNYNIIRYYKISAKSYYSDIDLGKTALKNGLITGFISGLLPLIVIGFGGYEIINNRLTLGGLIAFNSFTGYLFGPTNRLVNINVTMQSAIVALNRIKEIFRIPKDNDSTYKNIIRNIESLELNDVVFFYETNKIILNKISFQIYKGQKIGICGGSGGGKSTLFKILTGLYLPTDGKIKINGMELTDDSILSLRKHIAIVDQEPFLFDDSIYNNIAFGKAGATEEEILKMAQKARVDEFVKQLPDGYETQTGIKGGLLSVGQKQRIALARALLKQPKILLLDEATSAIDPISEEFIVNTIHNLPSDMIIIIVAHRLTTIKNCDNILVLNEGRIVENGTHYELMKLQGLYCSMNNI